MHTDGIGPDIEGGRQGQSIQNERQQENGDRKRSGKCYRTNRRNWFSLVNIVCWQKKKRSLPTTKCDGKMHSDWKYVVTMFRFNIGLCLGWYPVLLWIVLVWTCIWSCARLYKTQWNEFTKVWMCQAPNGQNWFKRINYYYVHLSLYELSLNSEISSSSLTS